ncbi:MULTISPECIES: cell envelope integrity EipB family protein [unclassified Shinella]|uniref:cell envelope integrity EipB family protein n=1 Tax=unclassified Shinella TaxID=2643062 RepID=UPI00234E4E31|nr:MULTISPECIES: cell envelope integrity EipB family protein [unclassified Shinella]MCO5149901.1 cell envelope integrity EipB family protein [Shinella sp.]MDC7262191.1 cell envelope integrity EipB family protein [Shinella sp. HY16]MDC7269086.1 cell envelope integrity EipB family protein [Shinella sp. YZ44]
MFRSAFVAALTAGACFAGSGVSSAFATPATGLAPHRAVYDLKLKDATERSGIAGMYGRMVYEFNGSPCDGYTVSFRFVTQVNTGEETRLTDQQTTTYEDLKTGSFRFLTRSFTDEKLDKEVRGTAREDKKGVSVDLTAPDTRQVELAASRFPTEHMLDVIDRAKKGERFFEARLFDGSDAGDKTLMTTAVVGKKEKPKVGDPDADKAGSFSKEAFWPVSIAYYNDTSEGDALPVYRMSFKLYENGITRDLTMDYGEFVLSGKLARLEMFKQQECK